MTIPTTIPTPGKLYTVNFSFKTDLYFKNERIPSFHLIKNDILLSLKTDVSSFKHIMLTTVLYKSMILRISFDKYLYNDGLQSSQWISEL